MVKEQKTTTNKKVFKTSARGAEVRDKFFEIMKNYNEGRAELAMEQAIEGLNSFMHDHIQRKFPTYMNQYYDDMYQQAAIGIIKALPNYNPALSAPTTYFDIYIYHEIDDWIIKNVNKTTTHYSMNMNRINKAYSEYEQLGLEPSPEDISIKTGIKLETVIQCLNIKNSTNEMSFESEEFLNSQFTTRMPSPEDALIEKEHTEAVVKALRDLTEEEFVIITSFYGFSGDRKSQKQISDETGITIEMVRRLMSSAHKKLRNSALKKEYKDHLREEEIINDFNLDFSHLEDANDMMNDLELVDINF